MSPTEQAIIDVLQDEGPSTPHEIALRARVAYRSLYAGNGRNLPKLREKNLIHIKDWTRQEGHGGPPVPVYALGPGEDAKRPKPKKNTEKCKAWRDKTRPIRQAQQGKSVLAILLGTRRADKKPKPSKSLILTLLEGKV